MADSDNVVITQTTNDMNIMSSVCAIPACATTHASRRNSITPQMFNRHGISTPWIHPSFMPWWTSEASGSFVASWGVRGGESVELKIKHVGNLKIVRHFYSSCFNQLIHKQTQQSMFIVWSTWCRFFSNKNPNRLLRMMKRMYMYICVCRSAGENSCCTILRFPKCRVDDQSITDFMGEHLMGENVCLKC